MLFGMSEMDSKKTGWKGETIRNDVCFHLNAEYILMQAKIFLDIVYDMSTSGT